MNIFYLAEDPHQSAEMHCDKHVVKMILEYAQLMSTAHRMCDGTQYIDSSSGRRIKRWRLDDAAMESVLYKASHVNHPSAIWVRSNSRQYNYMYKMFLALCTEYTHRYDKTHATDCLLRQPLAEVPANIPDGEFAPPPQCMPEIYKDESTIQAYKKYYIGDKKSMHKWKNRPVPSFITSHALNWSI